MRLFFAAIATAGLIVLTEPAAAAPLRLQPPSTLVQLNESYGTPGAHVVIPVDLKTPDGVQVGEIEIQLTIRSAQAAFVRAALSGPSEAAGVQVAVKTKPGQEPGTSVLQIVMTGRLEGAERQPIPNGQVAHLVFELPKTAPAGSVVPLAPTATAQTAGAQPAPVTPIEAPASKIAVSSPAIISCFFYMH